MNPNHFFHTRQLQYFISVAELLSFTKAAEANHIAQTAMSQNIITLEEILNVKLFERNKRNVTLTNSGKQFYQDAKKILEQLELSINRVQRIDEGFDGTLHIGFQGIHEKEIIPKILRRLKEEYPNIDIMLTQDSLNNLSEKLLQQTVDVIFSIGNEKITSKNICQQVISQEPICAVLPIDHPFAGKKIVKRAWFANDPVIFVKRENSASTFEAMMKDCKKANFVPNIVTYTANIESALMLVEAGMGVSFFPKCCQNFNTNIAFVTLEEDSHVDLTIRWKKNNPNPSLSFFLDIAKQEA